MIEVRIDELVLDPALRLDPEAIQAATEAELTVPPSARPNDTSRHLDAVRVGRELADTVRREVASR